MGTSSKNWGLMETSSLNVKKHIIGDMFVGITNKNMRISPAMRNMVVSYGGVMRLGVYSMGYSMDFNRS